MKREGKGNYQEEMSLDEICNQYPLEGLDWCYNEAKTWVETQVRNVEFLASKAGFLLGFEAAYLGILVGVALSLDSRASLTTLILLGFAAFFLVISAFFLLAGQWPLPLKRGLSPAGLTKRFVNKTRKHGQYQNLHELLSDLDKNRMLIDRKTALWFCSTVLLGLSILSLFAVFLILLIRR